MYGNITFTAMEVRDRKYVKNNREGEGVNT